MVENRAIKGFDRRGESAGRSAIGIAWLRIAAGMVVGEHDPSAAMLGGVGNDFAQRETGPGHVALVASEVEAPRLFVDMGDPQTLAPWVGVRETAGEEGLGGGETVEFQREFGTLIPHRSDVIRPEPSGLLEAGP